MMSLYDFILKMVCLQFIRVLERTSPVICNTKKIDKHQKPMCNQYIKTNISTLLNKEYSSAKIHICTPLNFSFSWCFGFEDTTLGSAFVMNSINDLHFVPSFVIIKFSPSYVGVSTVLP